MGIVGISVLFLLFCHCTCTASNTVILGREVVAIPPVLVSECKDANECPCSEQCLVCPKSWGPECATATCSRGRCDIILPCSQPLSDPSSTVVPTTTSPSLQCSGSDTSRCISNMICARCLPGYSPGCTEAVCVNGQCKVTSLCSIYTPTTTTLVRDIGCRQDNDCPYLEVCATQCAAGFGPLCTSASCVNGKCATIRPCSVNTFVTTTTTTTVSILPTTPGPPVCQTDGQCAYVKWCVPECQAGLQPLCAYSRCIEGRCVVTAPCSQKIQCTEQDTSQCIVPAICAKCLPGFFPGCAQASCDNGVCATINPCSMGASTISQPTVPTTLRDDSCRKDSDCALNSTEFCVRFCPYGLGPLCPVRKCVDGKCVVTQRCSKRPPCTALNTSVCQFPKTCAMCLRGSQPTCSKVTCENGECKLINPCTIPGDAPPPTATPRTMVTTTSTPMFRCTRSSQCPRRSVCVPKCSDGMTPLCASARCVKGRCIDIEQCSQRICQTAATCPFNAKNCVECAKSYGPTCEQAACKCGVCSIIAPCSKQLITMKPVQAVMDIWDGCSWVPNDRWTEFP